MNEYFLKKDGDPLERRYWEKFIKKDFPSYEKYWQKYITPLTNRPYGGRFKTKEELEKINKGENDIFLAQLHYTVLKHLVRVFDILEPSKPFKYDKLFEGITRTCAALDVADEFLERNKNPNDYKPWDIYSGIKARTNWRKIVTSTQDIRKYRNYLVHSLLLPSFKGIFYPKIGCQDKYYKWTALAHYKKLPNEYQNDFDITFNILKNSWSLTLRYLESHWSKFLKLENTSSNIINPCTASFTNSILIKGASDVFTEEEYTTIKNINFTKAEIKRKKKHKQKKKKKNKK